MSRLQPLFSLLPVLVLVWSGTLATGAEPRTIRLWPNGMPEPKVAVRETEKEIPNAPGAAPIARLTDISDPSLVAYEPADGQGNGTCVIVLPAGGFRYLTVDLEGSEACQWLAKQGVTAFLLKHRAPTHEHPDPSAGPVQDAQRAVQLVRAQAAEFGIQPDRIGVLGFSAGGQAAAIAALNPLKFAGGDSELSHKPDFLLLVYPWGLYKPESKSLRADLKVDKSAPPTFIAQAADDRASLPQGSALLYLSLLEAGVPAELHIYETGGHGFGLRPAKAACPTDWPERASIWLKSHGWLTRAEKP